MADVNYRMADVNYRMTKNTDLKAPQLSGQSFAIQIGLKNIVVQ
jgi:hypothetical protein